MEDLKKLMPKKLGFGCMRLPVLNGKTEDIDDAAVCRMVDAYMEQGFKYFDTAYPYHNQKSEEAVRRCIVERYDRESFFLADKLPVWLIEKEEDCQNSILFLIFWNFWSILEGLSLNQK